MYNALLKNKLNLELYKINELRRTQQHSYKHVHVYT